MKTYIGKSLLAGLVCLSAAVFADRALEPAEVEALLHTLTDQPRHYWIPSGTIRAEHLEFRQADEFLAESKETFTFDGQQWKWEITLDDSLLPEAEADTGDIKRMRISDRITNQKRLFCWDGKNYTRYYPNARYAAVTSNTQDTPPDPAGPLSAGIIPWGYGDYQFSTLLSRGPTAVELQDSKYIQLHLINENISPPLHNTFLLDPEKNYAVLSFVMENEIAMVKNTYAGYALYETHWVPRTIRTERILKTSGSRELISYEDWKFVKVSIQPTEVSVQMKIKNGTLVELRQGDTQKSFLYHASDKMNFSELLEEKLSMQSLPAEDPQNCATAAIRHLARQFSKTIPDEEISLLVSQESGQTSLFQLKQYLEEEGLYCLAVQTDLDSLRNLSACTIIVHFPGPRHYVILDRIEGESVWTIDLTSRKLYWKRHKKDFVRDWYEGTALLVSDQPTNLPAGLQTIETTQLYNIQGGDFGPYSCTDVIQAEKIEGCPEPVGDFMCCGAYYRYYKRMGCEEDENGGTCGGYGMEGYKFSACMNDPENQGNCLIQTSWYTGLIRACE